MSFPYQDDAAVTVTSWQTLGSPLLNCRPRRRNLDNKEHEGPYDFGKRELRQPGDIAVLDLGERFPIRRSVCPFLHNDTGPVPASREKKERRRNKIFRR